MATETVTQGNASKSHGFITPHNAGKDLVVDRSDSTTLGANVDSETRDAPKGPIIAANDVLRAAAAEDREASSSGIGLAGEPMTPFDAPGLFNVRLDNTRQIRAPRQDTAAERQGRRGQLQRKRSHPPSQLHSLSKWSKEAYR